MRTEQIDPTRNDRPFVRDVLPLVWEYLAARNWCGADDLHLVISNGNVRDEDISFCVELCRTAGDGPGLRIGELMLGLSPSNRRRVVRQAFDRDRAAISTLTG